MAAKEVAELLEGFYPDVGRVGLIMEGTGINHAHIKLVPMHGTEHMKRGEWKQYLSGQEHWFDKYDGWISSAGGPNADREKLKELANQLKAFATRLSQNKQGKVLKKSLRYLTTLVLNPHGRLFKMHPLGCILKIKKPLDPTLSNREEEEPGRLAWGRENLTAKNITQQ